MDSKLGLYVHADLRGALRFFWRAQPRVVKAMAFDASLLKEWRAALPDALIIGRLWSESQEYRTEPQACARDFCCERLLPLAERLRGLVDAWEGYNEGGGGDPEDLAAYADFEAERTWRLAEAGFRSVVGNFAAGRPALEHWECFLPALRAAKATGGFLGLHEWSAPSLQSHTAWDPEQPDQEADDEGWLTLRYRKIYRRGLPPEVRDLPAIVTECGIDGYLLSLGQGGWRAYATAEEYLQQLVWYDGELQKDACVVAACVGPYDTEPSWDSYVLHGELATGLQDHLIEHPPLPWTESALPFTREEQFVAALTVEFRDQFTDDRARLPQKGEYTPRPLDQIRYLVIHHTGTGTTPQTTGETLAKSRIEERGWPAINFHFLVYPDRVQYSGSVDTIRPHMHGYNDQAIGIALVGDFDEVPPWNSTLGLATRLCRVLERQLGPDLVRCGARDLAPESGVTSPGRTAYGPDGWLEALRRDQIMQTEERGELRQEYSLGAIRALLQAAFTPETLRRLCLDQPPLQPIVDHFGMRQGLDDMVDEVIDYCRTQLLWDELLAAVKEANPRQYARFEHNLNPA